MSTHTEHVDNPKAETVKYTITLVTLLILTAITVGASYINFGAGNVVIALTIATIKGCIVALIFMHLLHDKPVNAVIGVAGFIFLGIFLLFDFLDVDSRTNPQPINFHPLPAATAPAAAGAGAAGAPAAAGAGTADTKKE
jgi:caa(3)-type oxidase subunit IV